jgi:hypothetical protein
MSILIDFRYEQMENPKLLKCFSFDCEIDVFIRDFSGMIKGVSTVEPELIKES